MSWKPRLPATAAMLLLLFALVAAPVLVVIGLVALPTDLATQWSVAVVGIPLAAALFAVWAGILSRPFQWALKPGRFTRDLRAADYRARRLYGLCWTAVYYCTPIYFLVLSLPPLKRLVFRLFGLPGSCDFTTYPDTWLRDLPLVELGPGAYLSNRATIGTNIVMANGRILVDRVRIGARALIGHLSMLGPGADIGSGAEIGVGCGVGLRTRIGPGATIGPMSTVGNGVQIGARTKVGMQCLIGSGATLAAGLRLPDRMHVPRRTVLRTQADVDALNRPQALSEVKDAREILVLKPGLPA